MDKTQELIRFTVSDNILYRIFVTASQECVPVKVHRVAWARMLLPNPYLCTSVRCCVAYIDCHAHTVHTTSNCPTPFMFTRHSLLTNQLPDGAILQSNLVTNAGTPYCRPLFINTQQYNFKILFFLNKCHCQSRYSNIFNLSVLNLIELKHELVQTICSFYDDKSRNR